MRKAVMIAFLVVSLNAAAMSLPGPQGGASGVTVSTGLSDSSNLARLNAANVFTTDMNSFAVPGASTTLNIGATSQRGNLQVQGVSGSPTVLLSGDLEGIIVGADGVGITWTDTARNATATRDVAIIRENSKALAVVSASDFTTGATMRAGTFVGSGALLTNIPDSALSSNVPLKNGSNVFTNNMTIGVAGSVRELKFVDTDNHTYQKVNADTGIEVFSSWLRWHNDVDTLSGPFIGFFSSNGSVLNVSSTNDGHSTASLSCMHVIGNTGDNPPTIAAGVGAGTTPTLTISGHDMSGKITIITGTLPTGTNAVIATITLGTAYGTAQYPVLYPGNATTATLSGVSMVYTTGGTATWTITSGTSGLTAATTYIWYYQVGGY